jgi:hypothetical protein
MKKKKQKKMFDNYAATALQSLLNKPGAWEMKDALKCGLTQDQFRQMQQDVARTAFEYAYWMMKERPNTIDYLKDPIPQTKQTNH